MVGLARTGRPLRSRRVMRAALLLSTALTASAFVAGPAAAQNATWEGDFSNLFSDGANWSTGTAPSGNATAFFGTSPTVNVTSASNRTLGTIQFNTGADAYTIDINGSSSFQFVGAGIVNNSAQQQNFHIQNANVSFSGSASVGNERVTLTLDAGGQMGFAGTATMGAANIVNNAGTIYLYDNVSGGTAAYTGGGSSILNIAGLTASGMTIGSIAGTGGSILATNKALTVGGNNTTTTYGGVISGSGGSLIKEGSGTLTLTGVSTYTGGTTVNAGTLQIGSGGGLSTNSRLTVNGGTFDLNGNNVSMGGLSGTGGAITMGAGTLTITQVTSGTYAGTLSGTGSLAVNFSGGSPGLTLSGISSFSGGTTASGFGTLTIMNDAALGSATSGVTLTNNAVLQFGSSFTLAATRSISMGSGGYISTNGFSTLR